MNFCLLCKFLLKIIKVNLIFKVIIRTSQQYLVLCIMFDDARSAGKEVHFFSNYSGANM